MSTKLIVGLGNPGRGYSANRHNIGFLCLNHFAKEARIEFAKKQNWARVGLGKAAGYSLVLAKPQTYMNASGESVAALMRRYSLTLDDLVVVHDDLDLPLGKVRIRRGSSAAGHNGIKSIIANLGSQDFVRIRVGIGRPEAPRESGEQPIVDYVLGDFSTREKELLPEIINKVSAAILTLLEKGLTDAMNGYN
jgi:peptidyl-tRNA hydrolase, PTH1 family